MTCDIGLIGLAVMGENLVLNLESKGFHVAIFNRTASVVDAFMTTGRGKGKNIVPCHTTADLAKALKVPRKVLIMVKAGDPVDQVVEHITQVFEKGDVIIDGGNSHFTDTQRRFDALEKRGFRFVGCGVSGGEEGALNGPSLMPGGDPAAWPILKPILQKIAAKTKSGEPCCDWVGSGGAGHFVKMVHNGIEYGDMQLICEAYGVMKDCFGLGNDAIADVFGKWNQGELDSYLIEITRDILKHKDSSDNSKHTVDLILDAAGQKGTGKWTCQSALDLGQPLTLIAEAVFGRALSSMKEERVKAAGIVNKAPVSKVQGDQAAALDDLASAVFASKLVSYAQGFVLMREASKQYKWDLKYGAIALMWRGGCIIRSAFLQDIKAAFDADHNLLNLLLAPYFKEKVAGALPKWRRAAASAVASGAWMPAILSALSYYEGYTTARLPHNVLQAQRDFFGAHNYERVDKPRGEMFHEDWTGHGGSTTSRSYNQ